MYLDITINTLNSYFANIKSASTIYVAYSIVSPIIITVNISSYMDLTIILFQCMGRSKEKTGLWCHSNVMSHSLTIFPWVKWLLNRVMSGSTDKLSKHLTRYASVVASRQTTYLLNTSTRKTGSVEDSSCIVRGAWDLVSCF